MTRTAVASDWENRPMPEARVSIPLDRSFPAGEWAALRQCVVPAQMEDKWFIYWQDDRLHFHRSWTGICVWVARFEPVGDGVRLVGAEVNRDPEQYKSTNDERDARLLEYVIDAVLLRRAVEFPADPNVPDPAIMQAWAAVGRAALGEHPGK